MAAKLPPIPREPIGETFPWRDWLNKVQAFIVGGVPGLGTVTSIATGTGLSGGTITNTGTISIANTVAAGGPTGSTTIAPVITYNAQGQLTTVTTATITPAVGNVTGLGTGVATALGVNVGTAGAPVVNGGALGTPSGGTATNLTGTAAGLTAGTVTTNANLTGAVISSGNVTTITSTITAGGPIGSSTAVPVITYNAAGQLTVVTTAAISSGISTSGTTAVSTTLTNSYPLSAATWDPAQTSAHITLSGGNLIETTSSGYGSYASTIANTALGAGKTYWEITSGATTIESAGVAATLPTDTTFLGASSNAWGYLTNGYSYHNSASTAFGAGWGIGDTLGFAYDGTALTLDIYKNGVHQGQLTGLSGTLYPGVSGGTSASSTARFGATAFTYVPPSGYVYTTPATAWGGSQNGGGSNLDNVVIGSQTPLAGTFTTLAATSTLGYTTGAGGTVTQGTSRTTGVTINHACGAITLVSAAGSATPATFTVTNSAVAATDVIHVSQKSGTDLYVILVTAVAAGSFKITSYTTGGTTTEQPVFNFAVIKGVTA